MTLHNVIVDVGNSVFTCGQTYVALSRVTSLNGLNLINFDPRSIKALNSAVAEYTFLRKTFTPKLPPLCANKKRISRVLDTQWCIKSTSLAQQNSSVHAGNALTSLPNKGFLNNHNGYANSILQCLLYNKVVRSELAKEFNENVKRLVTMYESPDHTPIDSSSVCSELHCDHNPVEFLTAFIQKYSRLNSLIEHCVRTETVCTECTHANTLDEKEIIFNVSFDDFKKYININELFVNVQNWHSKVCSKCNALCKVQRVILNASNILVFKFDVWDPTGKVRRKANINCVPSSSLKIGTCSYKPKASVHYEQIKTAGVNYVSIVSSNGKWLLCHNQTLSFVQWPKGAKDMYMLFLERTLPKSDINNGSCNGKPVNSFPSKSAQCHLVKHNKLKSTLDNPLVKKSCATTTKDCVLTGVDMSSVVVCTEWPEYSYHPIDEEWQGNSCRQL